MFSSICWYVFFLGRAPTKKSKTKNQDEAEEEDAEAEDEEDPFDDLVSVSSEDSKGKSKGRSSGSKRSAPKVKVDQATKDEARKNNNPILGICKKAVRLLDPAVKEGSKASRSKYCSEELKEEHAAAKKLLKEANGLLKKGPEHTKMGKKISDFSMPLEGVKELAKKITEKAKGVNNLASTLSKVDEESLKKVKEAVSRQEEAPDVS